ncbi:PREDICTED: chromatin modification-related protein EAF3-like isoform X2 [Amphimedon queenslandica]|nr:PREDICTED: chromatin modification-related protein EAF3-like isoform X2 [Amphimedon queenslandica]|eukprot:XP_019863116.1 PREDICTED: chromatin modification-related protein EAF3-like isoform X2 [Amphimedon queenslandica]
MAESSGDETSLLLPQHLQAKLEQDCIQIVHFKKLHSLPVDMSVETILRNYWTYANDMATEETNIPILKEVLDGIKIYFDFMLRDHLLYSEERHQYDLEITKKRHLTNTNCVNSDEGTPNINNDDTVMMPSSVYGISHLLRLFVKMPLFLIQAKFPTTHINLLNQHFKDLLT